MKAARWVVLEARISEIAGARTRRRPAIARTRRHSWARPTFQHAALDRRMRRAPGGCRKRRSRSRICAERRLSRSCDRGLEREDRAKSLPAEGKCLIGGGTAKLRPSEAADQVERRLNAGGLPQIQSRRGPERFAGGFAPRNAEIGRRPGIIGQLRNQLQRLGGCEIAGIGRDGLDSAHDQQEKMGKDREWSRFLTHDPFPPPMRSTIAPHSFGVRKYIGDQRRLIKLSSSLFSLQIVKFRMRLIVVCLVRGWAGGSIHASWQEAVGRLATLVYVKIVANADPSRQRREETHAVLRTTITVWLCVALSPALPAFPSEPLVVELWPGNVPGDIGIKGEETSRIHQSPLVGPTRLITNVTKPTLTVYRPPAEKNTGTAMLICPGGGYWDLYWELEGEEVAAWLNSVGMTGIILKYRCPRRPGEVKSEPALGPQLDAQRAISLVRSRAAEWGIDRDRIGIVGFSAGGHLAIATATGFGKRKYEPIDSVDKVSCRPDFAVMCYSGYLKAKDKNELVPGIHIPADTPPVFLAHASDDKVSYGGSLSENSAVMYLALKSAGIPTELHIFATGDHDFGVRQNEKLPSSWTQLCVKWLRNQGMLKTGSSK